MMATAAYRKFTFLFVQSERQVWLLRLPMSESALQHVPRSSPPASHVAPAHETALLDGS